MKYKNKILCIVFALTLGFISVNKYSYADNTVNTVTKEEELQRELDETRKRLNEVLQDKDKSEEEKEDEKKQKQRDYNVSVDINSNVSSVKADTEDKIQVTIKNNGGENLEKNSIKISAFPDAISLKQGSSPVKNLSDIHVGNKTTANFEISVNKSAKAGTYPITFDFSGKYGTSVDNYKDYTYSKTFYIKIIEVEKEKKNNTQLKPFLISGIKHPAVMNKGDVGNLTFKITNPNTTTINSVKISVQPDDGIVNQSQSTFVENNFGANASKTFSVRIFPQDKAEKKNYAIKISVEPANPSESSTKDSTNENDSTTPKILPSSTQYTGIFYNAPDKEDEEKKDNSVKNPQIMISDYSYGESTIFPNTQFPLTMTFVNTSKEKTLRNIKISVSSDDGTFIVVGTSNSFYVDSMSPSSSVTKTLPFSVKPDATTKTVGVNIDYSYEDTKGNTLTSKDTISIPVMQKTLFKIDDIIQPQDVVEGEPINIGANFYNLGKTSISNLKITSYGDFTIQGDQSYFVGNMEPGKNDSVSISVIPNDAKKINGAFVFTYETIEGKVVKTEKKFSFNLNPIPAVDPNANQEQVPVEEKKNYKKIIVFVGIGIVILAGVLFKIRSAKKKKIQELDIDE